jgi:hypothetical protein
MDDEEFLDPMAPREFVFNEQKRDGPVKITPEFPVLKQKKSISTKRINNELLGLEKEKLEEKDEDLIEGLGTINFQDYNEIEKNKTTAKKFPNKIFMGTDGNYYKSTKNKKGFYVWKLLEKN